MRIATERSRPGMKSPPGALVAAGLVAVMGLYGFTTALQKSVVSRRDSIEAVRGDEDVKLASAVAATPSLVYAVSDAAPQPAPVVRRAATPSLPEPVIPAEPVAVNLASVADAEPSRAAHEVLPNAASASVNVSAVEAASALPSPAPSVSPEP